MRNSLASAKSRHRRRGGQMGEAIAAGERSHGNAAAPLPGYLDVRPSSIPGAGRGVFAQTAFRAGAPVLMATGSFVPTAGQPLPLQHYSFDIPGHPRVALQCFDDAHTNMIKYINSAHNTRRAPNATLLWHGCMLVVYAVANIRPGTELLLDYEF